MSKATEQLIDHLAASARPVRRLRPPAVRAALFLLTVAAVATPAGTDLNQEDLRARGKLDTLGRICGRIGEMVIQNRYFHRLVAALLPEGGFRVSYVPKSFCWLGDAPCRLRERAGIGGDEFVFFLPAGIRPVKGNLEGLRFLEAVHRLRPHVRAVFAGERSGSILDIKYFAPQRD